MRIANTILPIHTPAVGVNVTVSSPVTPYPWKTFVVAGFPISTSVGYA